MWFGGISSCAMYERVEMENELYASVLKWSPMGRSCHCLHLLMYLLLGSSQLLSPLPGPTTKPKYFPLSLIFILCHCGMCCVIVCSLMLVVCESGIMTHFVRLSCRPEIFSKS